MTSFTLNASTTQTAWSKNYLKAYTRASGFGPYMSTRADAIIRVNRDLEKHNGDAVRIPYFNALSGAGVTGSTALKGSEEALGNYSIENRITTVRHGVLLQENDLYKTDLELGNIAGDALKSDSARKLRDSIVDGLGSIPVAVASSPDSTKLYSAASEAEKDAWNTANADRLVFGTAVTNPTGDNSADLATIAAGEILSSSVLDYALDKAQATSAYKMTPYSSDATGGKEYFVFFTGTKGFNQLRADAYIRSANENAWTRDEMKNPIFQGGDLLWNGVIIRKIPEIAAVGTVGTASASVSPGYLCGSNTVSVAWGAMPEVRKDVDDYGEKNGIAIREVRGTKKMTVNLTDIGLCTVFYATV